MIALYVQTVVLLAIAYFLGAIIAYVIRRSLYRPAPQAVVAERRVEPLPEFVKRPQPARPAAQPAAVLPAAQPVQPAQPAAAVAPAEDLKRIRLVDEATEAHLKRLGITRYEHIAAWTAADVARVGQSLGARSRIAVENWIEQAQLLAKGVETEYARRRARGEVATAAPALNLGPALATTVLPAMTVMPQPSTGGAAAVVAHIIRPDLPAAAAAPAVVRAVTPVAATATATATAPAQSSPDVATKAAFAVESPRAAVPIRPEAAAAKDDLLRIGRIDATVAAALAAQGVSRYSDIAAWTASAIEKIDQALSLGGRISKENWIEQAQILSRGGDTHYSRDYDRRTGRQPLHPARLADAILGNTGREGAAAGSATVAAATAAAAAAAERPRSDIGALRSVRSEAFTDATGDDHRSPRVRASAVQDLKRIRGIGVLIEKKLASMGITSYETIANWTAADIDRVSQSLDFKGRIERENWIEQARILASGGATEFSRRVDRGEVESSRSRL